MSLLARRGGEASARLDDVRTRSEAEAERYVLKTLGGGGCSEPIVIWGRREGEYLRIKGFHLSRSGEARAERRIAMNDLRRGLDEFARALDMTSEAGR
jgi:porphobilinogen deaminase